jgi:DNA-binding MarR family transcriptional regulator
MGRMTDTEPRWLTGGELAGWRALAGVLVRLPAALDAQLQRDAGLSHFEYTVLVGLSEADGRTMRMSDLAGFTAGTLSRLSHVVKRMEERGWVRREPCPTDGRFTNAILTDAGWDKMAATAPGHVEHVRKLVIDALTPDQAAQLRDIGERILDRMGPA